MIALADCLLCTHSCFLYSAYCQENQSSTLYVWEAPTHYAAQSGNAKLSRTCVRLHWNAKGVFFSSEENMNYSPSCSWPGTCTASGSVPCSSPPSSTRRPSGPSETIILVLVILTYKWTPRSVSPAQSAAETAPWEGRCAVEIKGKDMVRLGGVDGTERHR